MKIKQFYFEHTLVYPSSSFSCDYKTEKENFHFHHYK